MKPVYQTVFSPPLGNCVQACVASILELPLEQVPNFMLADDLWREAFDEFLEPYGLYTMTTYVTDVWKPEGYHLICGPSPRGDYWHAIVGYKGKAVHDPYPDGGCKLAAHKEWTMFVARLEGGADA
jgi:hypothetical protein